MSAVTPCRVSVELNRHQDTIDESFERARYAMDIEMRLREEHPVSDANVLEWKETLLRAKHTTDFQEHFDDWQFNLLACLFKLSTPEKRERRIQNEIEWVHAGFIEHCVTEELGS